MRGIVTQVLHQLLIEHPAGVSSTQLAEAAGISRQAAHKQLRKLLEMKQLTASGKARACRYRSVTAAPNVTALRQRLEVASAGSSYRLSARLLLDGVEAGEVTLDFTGVAEIGEEFLDEIFHVWAPAHSAVTLRVAHLPAKFAPLLCNLARVASLPRGRDGGIQNRAG